MPREEKATVLVRFRATERDRRRLAKLARHYDRSASNVLRRLIADEYARVRASAASPPSKQGE